VEATKLLKPLVKRVAKATWRACRRRHCFTDLHWQPHSHVISLENFFDELRRKVPVSK
jgi:hypothetical protein